MLPPDRPIPPNFASDSVTWPDAAWKQRFRRRLLSWFDHHARDLPWRQSRTLYHVWISEIMLQQTQVVTVIPYFLRFIERFPHVRSLAEADEHDVLRLWEGLGYYRRARQLHTAAQRIMSEYAGQFPTEIAQVRALPGIGRYTAGAILSIATDAAHPILEANTVRLFSRLMALAEDPATSASQKLLWAFAEELLPRRRAGDLNQALMELGSEICTPREPACPACPVASLCPTRQRGLQNEIPRPKRKTKYEQVHETAVVVRRGGRVLLRRCQTGERWAGLWDFPRFAGSGDDPIGGHATNEPEPTAGGAAELDRIARATHALTGVSIDAPRQLTVLKHGVTRFRITLTCWEARCRGAAAKRNANGHVPDRQMLWLRPGELESLPLSATGRKIAELICQQR